jgi:4-carboxymuconolactone decarboxylase
MTPLSLNKWEKSLQPVIDDMGGRPLNIHALLAQHPALLEAWWPLRKHLVTGGELVQRECELVILRVATHTGSWYEWASHVVRGMDSGLTLEEINDVRDSDAQWDEKEAVLLSAVDELTQQRALSPEMLGRLGAFYTDRQVLDLMHLHGMYMTLAAILETWEVELDEHVARRLPDTVTPEGFARG